MERKMFSGLLVLFFVIGISSITIAEMSSENYSIPTSVLSGGGAPMSSDNYKTNSTLGQSSPLTDPADPPGSTNYELYPGFWYTLEASIPQSDCPGDFNGDGDVDGSDLATFAADFGRTDCDTEPDCEGDFDGDNDVDGSDLATFAADFGRTDCPY
jgi:hypothetical protein